MSVDLRSRHDRSLRERAVGMFERGLGYRFAARELGVPAEAVRNWTTSSTPRWPPRPRSPAPGR